MGADLPVEARIEDLVGRMTLEEKASQLLHSAAAVERLGVPAYDWWNEALHGIARSGKATVFPQAIGLAATFNVEVDIANTGAQASDEVVQLYVKHAPGSPPPNCSLVAFSRVTLAPGESRTVALPVTGSSLARFAPDGKRVLGETCELIAGPRAPMPGWDTPASDFARTTIRLSA